MKFGKFELVEPRVGEFEVRREVSRGAKSRRLLVLKRTTNIGRAVDFIYRAQEEEQRLMDEYRERFDAQRQRYHTAQVQA
jgi:hypothetical protein